MSERSSNASAVFWSIAISAAIGLASFVLCSIAWLVLEVATHCIGIGPCGLGDGPNHGSWIDVSLTFLLFACPFAVTVFGFRLIRRKFSKSQNEN